MTMDAFNQWIDKWIRPTTVMIVVGAIVWGVQLNIVTLNHAELISAQNIRIAKMVAAQHQTEIELTRTAVLLDQIAQRLQETAEIVAIHNKEAEEWKRRIMLNERRAQ
ncbi:hypothetical protein [Neptunomonas sp.]|uniref:hypothetical protein n=1 Tax=Neptunomonas sp. TaxID=1971898 RepID=UPI003562F17B